MKIKFPKNFYIYTFLIFSSLTSFLFAQSDSLVNTKFVYKVSENNTLFVGVEFHIAEHWHIYWENPGDTGIKTQIKWSLPEGFNKVNEYWPVPKRLEVAGLVNFGYEDKVLLYQEFEIPEEYLNKKIDINAQIDYLVCKVECIPGAATISDTADLTSANHNDLFLTYAGMFPASSNKLSFSAENNDSSSFLIISNPDDFILTSTELTFFPLNEGVFDYSLPQKLSLEEDKVKLEIYKGQFVTEKITSLKGVVSVTNNGTSKNINVDLPFSQPVPKSESLALILLFAFLGGIILNFMPCVLPVISLKILGFVQDAQEDKKQIMVNGLLFSGGVIFAFWVLTAALLILKAGGESLGWGFQLQEPAFVVFLIFLFFALALNLFGMFEIGASATAAGNKSTGKKMIGTFFSGVLATVVATPCTAPFMGTALGYTLSQPAYITVIVFTFLGLGMALPYLLFSAFPSWIRFLPKPGNWMISFKQFMGFILLATTLWLLWVISLQKGTDAVLILLGGMIVAALGLWIYGNWSTYAYKRATRIIAAVIGLGIMHAGMIYASKSVIEIETVSLTSAVRDTDGINWKPYSDMELNNLLKEGKPVFIDFTAAWCLTCQVNKKVAFTDSDVIEKFKEYGIVPLIADWTNRNEEITNALARFGRNSVPLYVLYINGKTEVLPELLTPEIVLDYINNLK